MRTLLALYICIYILFIYEERPHNVDLCNVCLFVFLMIHWQQRPAKASQVSSIYNIYIYISLCIGEKLVFVLALCVHLRLHISYHEVKIDPKNLFKARAQGMGKGGHSVRCAIVCKVTGNRAGRTWGPFVSGPLTTVHAWCVGALAEVVTTWGDCANAWVGCEQASFPQVYPDYRPWKQAASSSFLSASYCRTKLGPLPFPAVGYLRDR